VVTQFREVLRAVCEERHWRSYPTVLRFQDAWLTRLVDEGRMWNEIADDAETAGRSREETFRALIAIASLALVMHDPERGLGSKLAGESARQDLQKQEKLADCADLLAKHYRAGGDSHDRDEFLANGGKFFDQPKGGECFDRTELNRLMEERAELFEGEMRKFRKRAEVAAAGIPRQDMVRRKFILDLSLEMERKLGKPYVTAVMAITDMAFPSKSTTRGEVNDIRWRWRNRT
jgi:hypothetical protein